MRNKLIAAAMLLGGCGQGQETQLKEYSAGCVSTIKSEIALDQTKLEFNVDLMQRLMIRHGLAKDVDGWCSEYGWVDVTVRDTDALEVIEENVNVARVSTGEYDPNWRTIELVRTMHPWLHEYIHHHEWWIGKPLGLTDGEDWHHQWEEKGYFDLIDEYQNSAFTPNNLSEDEEE